MNKIVVVIPTHKENLNLFELISLNQVVKVLKNYDIYILCPKKNNSNKYINLHKNLKIIKFDNKYFNNIDSYNKFKLSNAFYSTFKKYDYILTYELDAFIFKDDIEKWINLGYDYIGAPWFENFNEGYSNKLIGVGNSGFSIRHRLNTLNHLRQYFNPTQKKLFKNVFFKSFDSKLEKYPNVFEDWFISNRLASFKTYKIAPIDKALQFSFEYQPEKMFSLNQNQLPTGCHAWWRYNYNFWKPYIEKEGYILPEQISDII